MPPVVGLWPVKALIGIEWAQGKGLTGKRIQRSLLKVLQELPTFRPAKVYWGRNSALSGPGALSGRPFYFSLSPVALTSSLQALFI